MTNFNYKVPLLVNNHIVADIALVSKAKEIGFWACEVTA
jgi:hypothetical protein